MASAVRHNSGADMRARPVATLLFELVSEDLKDPLKQFQDRKADKTGVKELLDSLRDHCLAEHVTETDLKNAYTRFWPDLAKTLNKIRERTPAAAGPTTDERLDAMAAMLESFQTQVDSVGTQVSSVGTQIASLAETDPDGKRAAFFRRRSIVRLRDLGVPRRESVTELDRLQPGQIENLATLRASELRDWAQTFFREHFRDDKTGDASGQTDSEATSAEQLRSLVAQRLRGAADLTDTTALTHISHCKKALLERLLQMDAAEFRGWVVSCFHPPPPATDVANGEPIPDAATLRRRIKKRLRHLGVPDNVASPGVARFEALTLKVVVDMDHTVFRHWAWKYFGDHFNPETGTKAARH